MWNFHVYKFLFFNIRIYFVNLAIAQPANTNRPVRKGTAAPSLVWAGLGGVDVVVCCIVQEIKVIPESPGRPAGVLLSMIG